MIILKKINFLPVLILIAGCSLSPGIQMETKSSWLDESKYVFIESINKNVKLIFMSTCSNYGFIKNKIAKENTKLRPISLYERKKVKI